MRVAKKSSLAPFKYIKYDDCIGFAIDEIRNRIPFKDQISNIGIVIIVRLSIFVWKIFKTLNVLPEFRFKLIGFFMLSLAIYSHIDAKLRLKSGL